ncbi:MAG: 50S ribosomal protein L11 methyltransferase [Coxiellaceae bacterium]|nr:50S ribosomal protein L11 methyltransferase [Coxiellaceae bacterium]|tara:strand:- start:756 stop:1658 length:903 start_codon:yes stop_codon:yes gene_type:complete
MSEPTTPLRQLQLIIQQQHVNAAEEMLMAAGALSVTIDTDSQEEIFQLSPEQQPLWQQVRMTALYQPGKFNTDVITIIEQSLQLPYALKHDTQTLIDKDWVSESQKHFPLQTYRNALHICPTWQQCPEHGAVVMLEPGLAFGTGTHPTTQLCLTWLADHPPQHQSVIDYGCGSGILALAALALGATNVWATDHDQQALQSTRNNLLLNPDLESEQVHVCAPEDLASTTAPLVIANILANPLVSLQPRLTSLVAKDGQLLLSGILDSEVEKITQAYQPHFKLININQQAEWVCMHFKKQNS